jgi:hypothetical protein
MIERYSLPTLFRAPALELFVALTRVGGGYVARVFAIDAVTRESREVCRRSLSQEETHIFVARLEADGVAYAIEETSVEPVAIPSPYIETVGDVAEGHDSRASFIVPEAIASLHDIHVVNSIPRGPNQTR